MVITVDAVRKEDDETLVENIPNGSITEIGLPKEEAHLLNKVLANNADLSTSNKSLTGSVCCEGDAHISFDSCQTEMNDKQFQNRLKKFNNRVLKKIFFNRYYCLRIQTKIKNCTIKKRVAHDVSQSPRPSPFRGYLTNKLECTECNYKVSCTRG